MINLFKKKILVTHDARFHADDVFACATLNLYFKKIGFRTKVLRTRDEKIIDSGDVVFDVGRVYDPARERYDHHQKEGAGLRENSIPYASFGLIWKHYGEKLTGSMEIAKRIDEKLAQPIDATDNGKMIISPVYKDVKNYDILDIVSCYLPESNELRDYDRNFITLVNWAEFVLLSEIKRAGYKIESNKKVKEIYEKTEDKRIIIIDQSYSWQDVLNKYPEPIYVVIQKIDGKWIVGTVRDDPNTFVNRKNLPVSWGGLEGEELQKVTGVPDAIFCHRNLFMAVAKTKESAIKLAQIALQTFF